MKWATEKLSTLDLLIYIAFNLGIQILNEKLFFYFRKNEQKIFSFYFHNWIFCEFDR